MDRVTILRETSSNGLHKILYLLDYDKKTTGHNGYHNENGPAFIEYNVFGNILIEKWYSFNKINRDPIDGPAQIRFYASGKIYEIVYYINGCIKNSNGPSIITYYENGNIKQKIWTVNKCLHNLKDEALIKYNTNGGVVCKYWYVHSCLHNINGPAIINYNHSKISSIKYVINYQQMSEDMYKKIIDEYDIICSYISLLLLPVLANIVREYHYLM